MSPSLKKSLIMGLMLVLVFSAFSVAFGQVMPAVQKNPKEEASEEKILGKDFLNFPQKIQPSLLKMPKDDEIEVYIITTDIYKLGDYLRSIGVDNPYGKVKWPKTHRRILTPKITVKAGLLPKIAKLDCVKAIFEAPKLTVEQRFDWNRAVESTYGNVIRTGRDISTTEHHGAKYVWNTYNITGEGVNIAIVDTGFDFANAELIDSYAICENASSPYYGWPIVFDQASMELYLAKGKYGFDPSGVPYSGVWPSSFYVNTSANLTATGGYITYDGISYKVEGIESKSGHYHFGYHIDGYLYYYYFFGSQAPRNVGVLVVDSNQPYVYDTVYVDLDNDNDFTDEKPCNISSPVSYRDDYNSSSGQYVDKWNGGDGYPDWSGGMIYFIADGKTPIPYSDVYASYYGLPLRIPGNGDLVAFIGEFFYGYTHGTMCSSSALGRGRLFNGWPIGMAPKAKLIPLPFYGNVFDIWTFTQEGYDGNGSTLYDGNAQITSNSFGWSAVHNDGWYYIDRMADYIIRIYPYIWGYPTNSFTIALGNGGPGYGTVTTPDPTSSIGVGAGVDMSYRRYLGWDNIHHESKYGDVTPFSARGSSANGKVLPDIIATGYLAFTAQALNIYSSIVDYINDAYGTNYKSIGDGYVHMQWGSGTSMATPITAGGLAMIYQAYKKTYGYYPDIFTAKALLKSGADDISYDVMTQGAGWLNVTRSVELALNAKGILVMPETLGPYDATDSWNAGGYNGTYIDMYANIMFPGDSDTRNFYLYNMGPAVENVNMETLTLTKIGEYSWDYTTQSNNDDVIWNITDKIPNNCDLMTVYMYYSYDDFDSNGDYVADTEYFIEVLDFVDENGDGSVDVHNETNRFTVSQNTGDSMLVYVHNIKDRLNGQALVRLRTITGKAGINLHFLAEFYRKSTWNWVSLSQSSATIDGYNYTILTATVNVPADASPGIHEGGIYITDSSGRVTVIPIIVNVAVKVTSTSQVIEIKNIQDDGLYTNTQIRGYMDWYWREESGDWRFFYLYVDESLDVSEYNMFADVSWQDEKTDIDVFILATGPPDILSQYYPDIYGEAPLEIKAMSEQTFTDTGTYSVAYKWQTTSGTTREVQFCKAQTGLVEIMIHNVLYGGSAPYEDFTLKFYFSNMTVNPQQINITLDITPSNLNDLNGTFDIQVTPQTDLDGIQVDSYGPAISESEYLTNIEVQQDDISGSDFIQILANAKYTKIVHLEGYSAGGYFYVHIWGHMDAPDLDLGIFYDSNHDGQAQVDEFLEYCADADADEEVRIDSPQDGDYIIKVLGYDVPSGIGHFDLYWIASLPVEKFKVVSQPQGPVSGGQTYTVTIGYNLPAIANTFTGEIYIGPAGNPKFITVPVAITVIDHCPPVINIISPAAGAIVTTSDVDIAFSVEDPVISGTISYTVTIDGQDYTSYFTMSGNNITGTVTLEDGQHNITVSVQDGAGNSDEVSWSFVVDSSAPSVVRTMPENNAFVSAGDVNVEIEFSEPMNTTSVENAITITPNATIDSISWNTNHTVISFVLRNTIAGEQYTIKIDGSASDVNGIPMGSDFTFTFTAVEQPQVISTDPANNAKDVKIVDGKVTVSITFNNPMNRSSVEKAITVSPEAEISDIAWSDDSRTITFKITAKEGTTYTITVKASAMDIYGSSLASDYTFKFITAGAGGAGAGGGFAGIPLWLLIVIIVVIVAVVAGIALTLTKKKVPPPEGAEEEGEGPAEESTETVEEGETSEEISEEEKTEGE